MKKFCKQIKIYFTSIDYALLWKSISEVIGVSLIAFLPLIISIILQWVKFNDLEKVLIDVLPPTEILAYCLSFLAPSILLLKKLIGNDYKVPFKDFFIFSTFTMYLIALIFVVIIKNDLDALVIKNLNNSVDIALVFLLITVVYRVYSAFHQTKSSEYFDNKKKDQEKFNEGLKKLINGN